MGPFQEAIDAGGVRIPSHADGVAFTAFLADCHASIQALLVPEQALAPVPETAVRALRSTLQTLILNRSAELGPGSGDTRRVTGGWTRLTGCHYAVLQCCSLLLRLPACKTAGELSVWNASDSAFLRRNGLVCWPGPGATARLSMSQFRLACDVLRTRLDCLDCASEDLAVYVSALEARCAALALGTGLCLQADDYDVLPWVEGTPPRANVVFLNTTCWWFTWVRRYITGYTRISRGELWPAKPGEPTPAGIARVPEYRMPGALPWPSAPAIPPLLTWLSRYARERMISDEYVKAWRDRTALAFAALPGDFDEFACQGGAAASEQPTVRGVLDSMRTPAQAIYFTKGMFADRGLGHWLSAAEHRCTLAAGCAAAGAPPGLLRECAAFMHCLDALFVSRFRTPWWQQFCIWQRAGHLALGLAVVKLVRAGMPFVVQLMGKWACCVPLDEATFTADRDFGSVPGSDAVRDAMARARHRRIWLAQESGRREMVTCFEMPNFFWACEMWLRCVVLGPWGGRLHSGTTIRGWARKEVWSSTCGSEAGAAAGRAGKHRPESTQPSRQ